MSFCHEGANARKLTKLCLRVFVSSWLLMSAAHAATQACYVGDMKTHTAMPDDTMPELARKNDIGYDNLRSANPYVDPWMMGSGTKLTIPTRHILPDTAMHRGIVINLPELRLYLFADNGQLLQTHPIGVGREGLMTPIGHTTVVRKVVGPIWRPTPRMLKENPDLPAVIGPGPDNPMGTNALYLGWPQYAIHGTDKPYAIGRRASSGCIRMYPEDILRVYPAVPVGTAVTVVNEPVKAAWIDGQLYVEANPPLDQAMMIEEQGGHPYYDLTDDDMREILRVAGNRSDQIDWGKLRAAIRERAGYPIAVTDDQGSADKSADNDGDTDAVDKPLTVKAEAGPVAAPVETKRHGRAVVAKGPDSDSADKPDAAPADRTDAAPADINPGNGDPGDMPAPSQSERKSDGTDDASGNYNADD
jgi:L,D-transpeptidase ErfK/SrfK